MSRIRSPRRAAGALAVSLVIALGLAQRPAPLCAQRSELPGAPIELVLDSSAGMRGRIGDREKIEVAREFARTLVAELDTGTGAAQVGIRVFGGHSPRASRDCRDSRLIVPPVGEEADLAVALNALQPRGVAPLAYALQSALADTARTYILIAGGLGECGGDACGVWREMAARRTNRNARLHVVAITEEPRQVELLKCLSRAGSGTYLVIADPAEVQNTAVRLALILKNQGLIDVRLSFGDGAAFQAPLRVLLPRSRETVAAFSGPGPHAVPAGMYSLVLETAPPIQLDRVLVLPGETMTIERSGFGRLVVEMRDAQNAPIRAPVTVQDAPRGAELRYAFTGDTVALRSGTYQVAVDLGDSVVARRGVVVEAGRIRRIALGGTGMLQVVSPEFPDPPPTQVLVSGGAGVDTLLVGETTTVPAGRYRLRVGTLPVYVSDEVTVAYRETTTIELPPLGLLRVEVLGREGPLDGVVARLREPLTGERYGMLRSGESRLVMPGTYRIDLETVPPQRIDRVVIPPGQETVVERRGFSRVVVSYPEADRIHRLELLVAPNGRRLAEAVGAAPSMAVAPGTYHARVSHGRVLLWQGEIVVAPDKTLRIDLPRP